MPALIGLTVCVERIARFTARFGPDALARLRDAVQAELDRGLDLEDISGATPKRHLRALANSLPGGVHQIVHETAENLARIALLTGVSLTAITALVERVAADDPTQHERAARLLLCGPSDEDAAAWATDPPDCDTVAVLLALRGH